MVLTSQLHCHSVGCILHNDALMAYVTNDKMQVTVSTSGIIQNISFITYCTNLHA
jgi:hypothetical protein